MLTEIQFTSHGHKSIFSFVVVIIISFCCYSILFIQIKELIRLKIPKIQSNMKILFCKINFSRSNCVQYSKYVAGYGLHEISRACQCRKSARVAVGLNFFIIQAIIIAQRTVNY